MKGTAREACASAERRHLVLPVKPTSMINLALTLCSSAAFPISSSFTGIFPENPHQVYLHTLTAIAAIGKCFIVSSEHPAPLTSLNKILQSIKTRWAGSSLLRAQKLCCYCQCDSVPVSPHTAALGDVPFLHWYPSLMEKEDKEWCYHTALSGSDFQGKISS